MPTEGQDTFPTMSVRTLRPRDPDEVLEEVKAIAADANQLGQKVLKSCVGIRLCIAAAFKTVYKHDTWTCPVTVQHSLQEICRPYGRIWESLEVSFERVAYSFDLKEIRTTLKSLQELTATTEQEFALPDLRDLEVYINQVSSYLSSDPGPLTLRMRRRWDPDVSSEPRVRFNHPRFDSSLLLPVHKDSACLEHLKTHHVELDRSLHAFMPLMRRWLSLFPHLSAPDGQYLLPAAHAQVAIQVLWELEEFLARDVLYGFLRHLGALPHISGWCLDINLRNGLGHGATAEDVVGAFEDWACVPQTPTYGRSPRARWLQALF